MENRNPPEESAIIDSIVSLLGKLPVERIQPALARIHRQLGDTQGAPVADPSIHQLHCWGRISTRSCMALDYYGIQNFDLGHHQHVHLSHVASMTPRELAKVANLGALCCHEIIGILADYGWRLRDAHDLPAIMTRNTGNVRQWLAEEQAKRQASDDRNHALLREKADEGLTWEALADRHGLSAAPLRARLAAFERNMQYREANPLPATIGESARADARNGA
ncbi:hypothetical protein DAH51_02030 [Sphingobium yanoikuyae]|uniref:Uncharacterized protein n=2 Tax=Sphingobium yanoikuyae TaxID=13690 RepID=A0A430C8V5_SPHYA|nr:hypothetical protein DAH51_02030 [Sphingobium yanoikuyae]